MTTINITFKNNVNRSDQFISVFFDNYDKNIYQGGTIEIFPPFGNKVSKDLTEESEYKFTRDNPSLLDNSNKVVDNCDLQPSEQVKKGEFKRGKYVVNIKEGSGKTSSYCFVIQEPKINIEYDVNILNSTCEIYDKTNYKKYNTFPRTIKYDLKVTAPEVFCNENGVQGKTYTAPEHWNVSSLLYINKRAFSVNPIEEKDRFIITPLYNANYYIRLETELAYDFLLEPITSSDNSYATATTKDNSVGHKVSYETGPVAYGLPVNITSPNQVTCDVWNRIKDIDTKYKQALCKNTILADKLRDILDRALQLYMLSKKATELGDTTLSLLYLDKIVDLTKTRLV
jgi:hypothetical protein